MTTQNNSLTFRNLGPCLPNVLTPIYQNSPHLIQNAFQPLFKIRLTESLFQYFMANPPPYCQEFQELYEFRASYDSTQSNPQQFKIYRDVIQFDKFTLFLSASNQPSLRQLSDDLEAIQSHYNY